VDAAAEIAPLAELIATLSRENRKLAAMATMWQERARFLGEHVRALEAGPITGDIKGASASEMQAPSRSEQSAQLGAGRGTDVATGPDTAPDRSVVPWPRPSSPRR
jgi:hypothetical protein